MLGLTFNRAGGNTVAGGGERGRERGKTLQALFRSRFDPPIENGKESNQGQPPRGSSRASRIRHAFV